MSLSQAEQTAVKPDSTFPWHELYTPNKETALDFYTKALGFGTQEFKMDPSGDFPGGEYQMLTLDGRPVCGVVDTNTLPMKDIPPHWAVYLAVDDVEDRLTKCVELGGTIVVPAMDVPTVGRMALIQDPTGAHIWLFRPMPQ